MAVKNWVYGAKTPDIEQAVSDAIFTAHRYRNKLCELELAKRERHYALLRELAPAFVAAEAAVDECVKELTEAREAIQAERVRQRKKTLVGAGHLTKRADDAKARLKLLRAELKEAKHAAYTDASVKKAMDSNSAQHKNECKEAKRDSGLYWGTEATVRESCRSFQAGAPPEFKRYDGTGQLSIQISGGLDCCDAERYTTLFYFGEWIDHRKRWCYIRIASEQRKPVFARLPVVFHRPLPEGTIKRAYLERRKIANQIRWSIRMCIDIPSAPEQQVLPGEVAVHTGWRMEPSGLRVATWLGSDGQRGCLRLSREHCDDYARLDSIKSQRDQRFNEIIATLREWLQGRDVPEWLAEIRPHLHSWKSPARLSKLYWQWADDRQHGDDDLMAAMDDWRKRDKHDWQHSCRMSTRIKRRRKHLFRNFAKTLADQYGVVFLSPIDVKDLNRNSDPEDLERDNTQAHRHSKWASVSELTEAVREKFPLHTVDVSCVNISRQCCNCGNLSATSKRQVQCRECGQTHDVDDNAVANTFARGDVRLKSGALLELKEEQEVKDANAKAKLAKMQESRRASRERELLASETTGK